MTQKKTLLKYGYVGSWVLKKKTTHTISKKLLKTLNANHIYSLTQN